MILNPFPGYFRHFRPHLQARGSDFVTPSMHRFSLTMLIVNIMRLARLKSLLIFPTKVATQILQTVTEFWLCAAIFYFFATMDALPATLGAIQGTDLNLLGPKWIRSTISLGASLCDVLAYCHNLIQEGPAQLVCQNLRLSLSTMSQREVDLI